MREVIACRKIASAVVQIRLPEVSVPFHQRVFAGDAVDDDVEPLVGAEDAPEERFDFGLDRVIDANGDGRYRPRP